jgi:hypothetical protein
MSPLRRVSFFDAILNSPIISPFILPTGLGLNQPFYSKKNMEPITQSIILFLVAEAPN